MTTRRETFASNWEAIGAGLFFALMVIATLLEMYW